jgi:hypothetical protein
MHTRNPRRTGRRHVARLDTFPRSQHMTFDLAEGRLILKRSSEETHLFAELLGLDRSLAEQAL